MMLKSAFAWLVMAAFLVVPDQNAHSCTTPVFRYALENWPASPYRLAVLHKDELDDSLLQDLQTLIPLGTRNLQFDFFQVDKGDLPLGLLKDYWEENLDTARLPLGLLFTPPDIQSKKPLIFVKQVDLAGIQHFKDKIYSPLMREVLKNIASGDTAVWILAKSADESRNRELRHRLEQSLAAIKTELRLPHELDPIDTVYAHLPAPGIPLRKAFSIIETNLDDPANDLLRTSLESIESESLKKEGPWLIPVYGRGRALALLHHEETSKEILQEICFFLVGPCSCRIKDLNPGFDLPSPFPWDTILYEESTLAEVLREISD